MSAARRAIGRWVLLVSSVLFIAAADIPWGDFQNHPHWGNVRLLLSAARPLDCVLNVLLFVPFGFALRRLFDGSPARIGTIAALVSLLGEGSQVFSHERIPAVLDVVCNVTGAVAGAVLVASMRASRARRPRN